MLFNSICAFRDALFKVTNPPFCVYCTTWLKQPLILCEECRALIQPIVSTTIKITSQTSMQVFSLSAYQEPLKTLILAKTKSMVLASKQLGELIYQMTPIHSLPFDYCVPIPLHWTRYAYRGYNQAEMMANVIAKKHHVPALNLLKRTKRTILQAKLSTDGRAVNLEDAFIINSSFTTSMFRNKDLVLVDDLMTTGATLKSAAQALLVLNPASITAVVACRTI